MVATTRRATIQVVPEAQTQKMQRYVRDDSVFGDVKFHYVQGHDNRHIQLFKQNVFETYPHSREVVEEIASSFADFTGLEIPDDFLRRTTVYLLRDLLRFDGIVVPFRVDNTSVFLSGSVFTIEEHTTWSLLYHALGNALWNFIDTNVWKKNVEAKNRYREIRGIPIAAHEDVAKEHNYMLPFQRKSLFYIAGEDFRVLFGPSMVSKKWELDTGDFPIAPPTPEVVDFWMKELAQYGKRPD